MFVLYQSRRENKEMKKVFGVFKETVLWVLGFDGKKRRWAVDNGLCDFSGQGRDKYGK